MNLNLNLGTLSAVFIGGGVGCVFRYLISLYFNKSSASIFPLGTFVVNMLGCLLLGFFFAVLMNKSEISSGLKLFLSVGFCGGLTTFSTFSWELITIFPQNQILALLYGVISLIFGLFFVLLGIYIGGAIVKNV